MTAVLAALPGGTAPPSSDHYMHHQIIAQKKSPQASAMEDSPDAMSPTASSPTTTDIADDGMAGDSLTSKDWIVPSRPRPGRKPAQDTPPTKRKEQNRAAQRAFRERRAARVQELEGILQDKTKQHEEHIRSLYQKWESEKDSMRNEIAMWRARYEEAQKTSHAHQMNVDYWQKRAQDAAQDAIRWSQSSASTGITSKPSSVDQAISPPTTKFPPMLPIPQPRTATSYDQKHPSINSLLRLCSRCGKTGCRDCTDKAKAMSIVRPSSPKQTSSRNDSTFRAPKVEPSVEMEIDFTSRFSSKPVVDTSRSADTDYVNVEMQDQCGFCRDGTTCICRQLQKADEPVALPKPQPIEPTPGSCEGCINDPLRRAFCISLSAYSSSPRNQQPASSRPAQPPAPRPELPGIQVDRDGRMSCSDAYTTLRKNMPDFDRHVNDKQFYEQLRPTRGCPDKNCSSCSSSSDGKRCAAFELEAANVLTAISQSDGGNYLQGKR